jgi:death-on-curing protein
LICTNGCSPTPAAPPECGTSVRSNPQPHASFGGQDLYPDLVAKAAALCYSLVMNHAFVDGNKRVGHAAMETFLLLNGHEIQCGTDEQERVILQLAAGDLSRNAFTEWVRRHTTTA